MDVACIRTLPFDRQASYGFLALFDMASTTPFPRLQMEQPATYTAQIGNLVKLEAVKTDGRTANGCKR